MVGAFGADLRPSDVVALTHPIEFTATHTVTGAFIVARRHEARDAHTVLNVFTCINMSDNLKEIMEWEAALKFIAFIIVGGGLGLWCYHALGGWTTTQAKVMIGGAVLFGGLLGAKFSQAVLGIVVLGGIGAIIYNMFFT